MIKAWQTYKEYLSEIKWAFEPKKWLIISIALSLLIFALCFISLSFLKIIPMKEIHANLFSIITFITVLDLLIAYPYIKASRRISKIENALPDAFKQMADTLKAGGTFEYALRSISTSAYGPLTDEIALTLRRLEEGENLEGALKGLSNSVNSRLLNRAISIILDSIAAGASLADILDEIADDVRSTHRIIRERQSTTLMQVLFMVSAGILVSPFIFGLVNAIVEFLLVQTTITIREVDVHGQIPGAEVSFFCMPADFVTPEHEDIRGYWNCVGDAISLLLVLYIIIESAAVGFMVSLIRDGNISKSFIYIPVFLFMAYLVYYASYAVISGFFG